MITLLLMSLVFFALGILLGYRWCMVSEPTRIRLEESFERGYERAMLFYRDMSKNWPHGDPGDIRSYTPGPGPKPRSKGPADYVDGHEMGSHPGDCHGRCCSGEMGS